MKKGQSKLCTRRFASILYLFHRVYRSPDAEANIAVAEFLCEIIMIITPSYQRLARFPFVGSRTA